LLAAGHGFTQIALRLKMGKSTAKNHVSQLLHRFDLLSSTALVVLALKRRFISLDEIVLAARQADGAT
jgi:DNA-binding NarL/FixJ family response regulator